ncbi:MAG: alpha/beta hydrolase family protein [Mangrovibacterium sp.]
MKRINLFFVLVVLAGLCHAQNIDTNFAKPLEDVLKEVEQRFQIQLSYDEKVIQPLQVEFAQWRFRDDAEETLHLVLGTTGLVFEKQEEGNYKIERFRYHIRPVDEGRKHLERLAKLYPDLVSWESRKVELKNCILNKLGLNPMPEKMPLNPVSTPVSKMDGYTVQHVALESLPGVYVSGTLYRPLRMKGKHPAVLLAQGHGEIQHYGESSQKLAGTLARMGAVVFSYDMFAKGESALQFAFEDHRTGMAQTMQTWSSIRVLDFLSSLPEVDASKIGMTGASGGGTQTFLLTALDDRIAVSAPVVMVSSWFFGGCPCESGMPIHMCGPRGTNNVEIAAMASPRPLLVVSDGGDWTANVPEIEFPYLQARYALYNQTDRLQNVHLPDEGHDYGPSKRAAVYQFFARKLGLDLATAQNKAGQIDESSVKMQSREDMLVFGLDGAKLPTHAIHGLDALKSLFPGWK